MSLADTVDIQVVEGAWVLLLVLIVVAIMGAGLTWAILRAARHPQPIMLIIVMSLLTVTLVSIYVVVDTNDQARQVLATMAATALGSLVTATAHTFREASDAPTPPEEAKPDDEEEKPPPTAVG